MADAVVSWVVYRITPRDNAQPVNAVCEQSEWDAMERRRPGLHTLVRDHIVSESEAELLARGTSGDPVKRPPKPRAAVAVSGQENAS